MPSPTISFFRGDNYTHSVAVVDAEGNPLNLTGAAVLLVLRRVVGDPHCLLRKAGSVTDPVGGLAQVSFVPTDFSNIGAGSYVFEVQVSLPGGVVHTPQQGFFFLKEDIAKEVPPATDLSAMAKAKARFVGADGVPVQQKVLVAALTPAIVGSMVVTPGKVQVYEADTTGVVEFLLVRGLRVRVALEGTSLIKEFVVPDTAEFDLLTVLSSAPDMFSVQTPPPLLTRRTL